MDLLSNSFCPSNPLAWAACAKTAAELPL